MFEEIAKRIHQVAEAWQYACDAGNFEQANFHRGELSQLIHEMKSAQQSVQRTAGDSAKILETLRNGSWETEQVLPKLRRR